LGFLCQPTNPPPSPRVMVYHRSCPDFELVHCSKITSCADLLVFDVVRPGQPTVTIVNIYNPPQHAKRQTSAVYILCTLNQPQNRPIILAGDWNLHHPYWSADDKPPHSVCSDMVEWLDSHEFLMHNQKGKITCLRKNRDLVLDHTFSNAVACQIDLIKNWQLDVPLSGASDHISTT